MTCDYSVSRKASFPCIIPLLSLLPPTTSLLCHGVEVVLVGLCSLKHGASLPHPTSCLLIREVRVPNRVLQSPYSDRNFPSLFTTHMTTMTSHPKLQLRRQYPHSQFLIIWKSHKIEYNWAQPFPCQGVPHWRVKSSGVRQSKIYKCPERSFGS